MQIIKYFSNEKNTENFSITKSKTSGGEAAANSMVTEDSSLNIFNNKINLPLSQFHIFSSWDSACSGNFISTQQIQNVISTGCRFLDFPVTDLSGVPSIFPPRFKNDLSLNSIPLSKAIDTCITNAFQKHITISYEKSETKTFILNNYNDPLFINLRIQPLSNNGRSHSVQNQESTISFLNKIAEQVGYRIKDHQFSNKNYSYEIKYNTPIHKLQNKVVLLVDITNISGIAFDLSELSKITNLVVGHYSGVMMYPFKKLLDSKPENIPSGIEFPLDDDDKKRHKRKAEKNINSYLPIYQYTMAIPDSKHKHQPNIKDVTELAIYHNVQFMPFMFYNKTDLLMEYIKLFQLNQSAFIPIQVLNQIYLSESEKAVMK